jgi:hypothetical protein
MCRSSETLKLLVVYKKNVVEKEGVDVVWSCKLNLFGLWHNDLTAQWAKVNLMALCKIVARISKL